MGMKSSNQSGSPRWKQSELSFEKKQLILALQHLLATLYDWIDAFGAHFCANVIRTKRNPNP